MGTTDFSRFIKEEAKKLGFLECGIIPASYLQEDALRLDAWLLKGMNAGMRYMGKNNDKRKNPANLVPGAKSVIICLFNYYPSERQSDTAPKVAKYAYGKDYHFIIRSKLYQLLNKLREIKETNGRAFSDSAPVMERALARLAGLGWIGKNSLLLSKSYGSFFFIGELITDLELEYDTPVEEACGLCNLCVEACPTKAIVAEKIVDSNKCISYYTIEHKDDTIPSSFQGTFRNQVFGCDICQDVCPWNRKKSAPHHHEELKPISELISMTSDEWYDLDESRFNFLFKESPLARPGYKGIKRNLSFIREN